MSRLKTESTTPLMIVVLTLTMIVWFMPTTDVSGAQNDTEEWSFTTLGGEVVNSTWTSLSTEGEISGTSINGLALPKVTTIQSGRDIQKSNIASIQIRLVDGGTLLATSVMVANEIVTLESECGINEVPLQNVKAILWKGVVAGDLADQALQNPSQEKDTVVVDSNGTLKSVSGLLESVDAERLMFVFNGKTRPIKSTKAVAVVVANLNLTPPQGSVGMLSFTDGSTLRGALRSAAHGQIELELSGGKTVSVLQSRVAGIVIESDSLLWLSDLQPVTVEQSPVFAAPRQWKSDLSVGGNPMKLSVAVDQPPTQFKKGLGVQSYSRLVFANTNGFDRFQAVAGIDAETQGRGDCVMSVRGDGIDLWTQRVLGGEPGQTIDVDISGINEIELIVRPGELFDLGDHADWADAKFLKTK